MTGICAFSSTDSKLAESKVETMLRLMEMRGRERLVRVSRAESRSFAIGYCNERDALSGKFSENDNSVEALDGAFFQNKPDQNEKHSGVDDPNLLFSTPGGFAFIGKNARNLVAARDELGQKPIYWGTDENGDHGFASTISTLLSVEVIEPIPVVPGQVIELNDSGLRTSHDHSLTRPEHVETPEDEAVERVGSLLLKAVSLMVPESSALAFSGGVDSAIVATACKKLGLDSQLITVAMEGQDELEHAKRTADEIGLKITRRPLTQDEVIGASTRVAQIVETKSPVTLGISLPFYFACTVARELGKKCIVMGQLSDELFGGYARFEHIALKEGPDAAGDAMWNSVVSAAEGDFAPGDKVAMAHGLELRCPFAYLPLAKFALELPVGLRVRVNDGTVVRKYLLRRLAEKWSLPDYVVNRPKKAFQYSSGVNKVLVRETKRKRIGSSLANLD